MSGIEIKEEYIVARRDVLHKSDDHWYTDFAGPLYLGVVWLACMSFFTLADRWLINLIFKYRPWLKLFAQNHLDQWKPVEMNDIWGKPAFNNLEALKAFSGFYHILLVVFFALSCWVTFRWWRRFHIINNNEYGTADLATEKEVKESATAIPDRNESFPGLGGIPVSHTLNKNVAGEILKLKMTRRKPWLQKTLTKMESDNSVSGKYYIDQSTVNTLIIGITRSGKGEMIVNPLVDILSRAEEKSSMVVNDPKGELFQMSYNTLRKRGYDVQVLNLLDMNKSMSYNPLEAVIEFAKRGDVMKAQQYVNSVSTAIYKKSNNEGGGGNDAFWENSSISLLNALILALVDIANRNENHEKDPWQRVTLRNAVEMLTKMGAQKITVDQNNKELKPGAPGGIQKSKLSVYFENLAQEPGDFRDQAFQSFQQSNFAGEETAGNVYSSAIAGINLYLQDDIARLTSKNSIDLTTLGFPRQLEVKMGNKSHNNPYINQNVIVTITDSKGKKLESRVGKIDDTARLSFPIKAKLPDYFTIKLDYNHISNRSEIRNDHLVFNASKVYKRQGFKGLAVDKYSGAKILEKVALHRDNRLSTKNRPILHNMDIRAKLNYSDKPVALFMVTPPHNPAYNMIVSFLVDQIFNLNYEMALLSGRKCFNRITFILDEFGNLPAINAMDTKVSIGLGQNILFNIIVQNLEQLTSNYGKEKGASIQSNCANLIYILTKSNETAKTISEMAGKRTVNTATNNGNWNNIDSGSTNNQRIGQELFTVDELQHFKDEEMLVFRSTARRDRHGHRIVSKPIYDTGNMIMPYRYMFLGKAFDENTTMAQIPVDTPHLSLELKKVEVDFNELLSEQQARLEMGQDSTPNYDEMAGDSTTNSGSEGTNNEALKQEIKLVPEKMFANEDVIDSLTRYLRGMVTQDTQLDQLTKDEFLKEMREHATLAGTGQIFSLHNDLAYYQNLLSKENYRKLLDTVRSQTKAFEPALLPEIKY